MSPIKNLTANNLNKIFLGVVISSLVLGVAAGYLLSSSTPKPTTNTSTSTDQPKTAQQDNRTFRDFAEGTVQKRSQPKNKTEYIEGTHILTREGSVSVALTSSVIDLSEYEGKKVKVYGETQKAIKEGWLMDVGKVEVK